MNFKKIVKISERIAELPQDFKYRLIQFKYYWKHFRWPKSWQWKRLDQVLTRKEKAIILTFLLLFLGSGAFLISDFYLAHTHLVPARSGEYAEGIIGTPSLINPIYADRNDADRDLVEILFSGLLKYNKEGQIVPDLAKDYEIKEDGKLIEVNLRKDVFWSDGERITADDVVFTIEVIQDPDYRSPLRTYWLGVKTEKVSETTVSFKLKTPYSAFLERLVLKIIPKHVWEDISAQNFSFSPFNLNPIGSGPYLLTNLQQDKEGFIRQVTLEPNSFYYQNEKPAPKPYLAKINLYFFDREEDLRKAFQKGEIEGFSCAACQNLSQFKEDSRLNLYSFLMPRYFAVFFNLNPGSDIPNVLNEEKVRRALNYGTDKEEIVAKLLEGEGLVVHSPILPEIYDFTSPKNPYYFDLEKARELLKEAGFDEIKSGIRQKTIEKEPSFRFEGTLRLGSQGQNVEELQKCLARDSEIYPEGKITGHFGSQTEQAVIKFQEKYYEEILKPWGFKSGTGIVAQTTRAKLNEICASAPTETVLLSISLITVEDPLLLKVAELLKEQWEKLAAEVKIESYPSAQIEKEFIKARNYQTLLFGESLGMIPDPYPFWHSSQEKDPGLNLAQYKNKIADELLKSGRTNLNPQKRAQTYQKFQEILVEEAPSVFLFSPKQLYFTPEKIKGMEGGLIVNPAKRFLDIENWYIKEKRTWIIY